VSSRFLASIALAFLVSGSAAVAQTEPSPPPSETAAPAPLPPAGVVPAALTVDVTGTPATDADVIDTEIRAALNRAIRPTLRPGAAVSYGPIVPWPLLPLALGQRTAIVVTVTIEGDLTSAPVQGTTMLTVENVPVPQVPPRVLYLSDDPEYLWSDGLVFRGGVDAATPARLYYYQSDLGLPRDVDVLVTAPVLTRVQLIGSGSGPDLDVMAVGHSVSRDFLRLEAANEGTIVDVGPGRPVVLRHALILQGEVVAGVVDAQVLSGGPARLSVIATPAGGHAEAYLDGPRVPYDGHHRHGAFSLAGFGDLSRSYTVGGPDVAVRYGGRNATPPSLDPNDPGRDYGDYGVIHRITFSLDNPTDDPQLVYLYERPLAGPVRSTFIVDGQMKDVGCARLPQQYRVMSYQLAPQSRGASTTITMTDGGSFYPLEFGVTSTPPLPTTPPVGAPEGCSPVVPAFNDATPAPAPAQVPTPAETPSSPP